MNRVVRIRPAADHESHLAAAVSEAADLFDVDTHGLDLAEAARILGERAPDDVLWIVDGTSGDLGLPGLTMHTGPRAAADQSADAVLRAAPVVERALAGPVPLKVYREALEIAGHPAAAEYRLDLLRAVAAGYERRGDTPAAARVWGIVADGGEPGDGLAAARLDVETGYPLAAIHRTAWLIQAARRAGDVRTEYRARFIAATAHDALGGYPFADKVFHRHRLVAAHGPEPAWLGQDERRAARLARVHALRVRGEYRAARELLDSVLPEVRGAQPLGSHRGEWPVAMLEDARLHLVAGDIARSRETAARVADRFARAGWSRHKLARAAVAVLTEGEHGAAPARRAADESAAWFGEDDPLTLELRIIQARALCDDGHGVEAIAVLAAVEARAEAGLGVDHPLTLAARQGGALARIRLRDWETAARALERLAPRQDLVLGAGHPDSRRTKLELGLCLAKLHHVRRARPLLLDAVKARHPPHDPWQHWVFAAHAATALAELPGPLARWFSRPRAQPGCQPIP